MADYPGAHSLLVGGRGFGKRAAREQELNAYLAAVTAEHPSIPPAEVIGNLDIPGEFTYTRRLNAPDEHTGNPPESIKRNVAAQLSVTRTVMDELTRHALAVLDTLDPRPRVAELIAHSPRAAPPVIPAIARVYWSCLKPTDPAPWPVGSNGWLYEQAHEVLQGRRTVASVVAEIQAKR